MAHLHYKGTGKVHSFRGLLPDGKQHKIRIQGPVGAIAWRITKFMVMPYDVSDEDYEAVVKIYRESQSSIDHNVDFTDSELLGAGLWSSSSSNNVYPDDMTIIFDNALFSRNIYITYEDTKTNGGMNYYIELEEVKVSAAGMAQLAVAAARRTID